MAKPTKPMNRGVLLPYSSLSGLGEIAKCQLKGKIPDQTEMLTLATCTYPKNDGPTPNPTIKRDVPRIMTSRLTSNRSEVCRVAALNTEAAKVTTRLRPAAVKVIINFFRRVLSPQLVR